MSGICGIYRFHDDIVTHDEIYRMNHTMASLGPDGAHIWHAGSVGFGFQAHHLTHESIHETLPYYDAASSLSITTDCRLDNRDSLCKLFHLNNNPSLSDSFLILSAYQKWGKDCPNYLLGEFAVAIWDKSKQELFCFVDHTGLRTFYYYHDANLFAFSSTIHALHTLTNVPRAPNLNYIAGFNNISYMLNRPEITCYDNIFKFTSRTLFVITPKNIQRQIYWQPDIQKRTHFASEDEYIEAFQELFSTIISDKLRSHCPVVTLHSGGLDSSSITAMAAHLLAKKDKSLTALSATLPPTYQGNATDENYYIQLLQNLNLQILPITDTWRGPFDELDNKLYSMTSIAKTSRYYLYKALATAAHAQGARIILDGCYGEKGPSFHGNGYYAELLLSMRWKTLLQESRMHAKLYDRAWWKIMVKEGVMPCLPASLQAKLNLRHDIALLQHASFIKSTFINKHVDGASFQRERQQLSTQYPNHRYHQHQAMCYLHTDSSIIHSDNGQPIHFSYPYNDKRMLEFCLAMPGNLKVRNGYKRYAIRSGMRGLMPDELRFRTTKEPFSPDYHERYNKQLSYARAFVAKTPKTALIQEIIDIPKLELELKFAMQTNRCATKRDFMAMHTIPFAISLLAFLSTC